MPKNPPNTIANPKTRRILTLFYALPIIFVLGLCGYLVWNRTAHQGLPLRHISGTPFATVPIKGLKANLFTTGDELRPSGNDLFIEFRDSNGRLVDVGDVTLVLVMKMPGSVMHSIGKVNRTATPGQYRSLVQPQMSGEWTGTLGFSGTDGNAETNFTITVK